MSKQTAEIKRLLKEIDNLPIGPQERALIDQALGLAQEAGDEALEYRVRLRLTTSAFMTGDAETTLSSWSWCLGKHDSDPRRFPFKKDGADLLWQHKWTSELLAGHPRFNAERIEAVVADMERRYRAAGVGLSGVWQTRMSNALSMGRLEESVRYRDARESVGGDEYSHCDACVRSEDAALFAALGDREQSLAVFDQIIEGNFTCGDEPERAQAMALLQLLRAGRLDDAVAHHRRGLRLAKSNPDPFPLISHHITFCALTGNAARGLALLERYLHELPGTTLHAVHRFEALVSYGVLLDEVVRAGHGDTLVRGTGEPAVASALGLPGGEPVSALALAEASWRSAAAIADAFDQRNGNHYYAGLIAAARGLATERYDLPLGGETFVADSLGAPSAPIDAQGWIDQALEELVVTNDADAAWLSAQQAIDVAEESLAPRALSLGISALLTLDRREEAQALLTRRIQAMRTNGDADEAALEERLGLLLFGDVDDASGELLAGEIEAARDADAPSVILASLLTAQSSALLREGRVAEGVAALEEAEPLLTGAAGRLASCRAQLALADDRPDEAAAAADRLLAEPSARGWRILTLRRRAQLYRLAGDAEAGLRCADELLSLTTALGHRPSVSDAAALGAVLLSEANRDAEAAVRQQVAIRHALLADLEVTGLRFMLGRYLHWSGQYSAAADTFDDVLAGDLAGDPVDRADTLLALGHAARAADEFGRAYDAYSRCLEVAERAEAWERVRDAALSRGQLLLTFDDRDALDDLTQALEAALKVGSVGAIRHVHHVRGRARITFGDQDGLEELDQALRLAQAEGHAWVTADIRDSRGRGLLHLGRTSEGVAAQLQAACAYAEAGDAQSAAMAEWIAARALRDSGDPAAAVTIYRAALERLEAGFGAHSEVSLELGDALEGLGRLAEAEQVRARVTQG